MKDWQDGRIGGFRYKWLERTRMAMAACDCGWRELYHNVTDARALAPTQHLHTEEKEE